MEPNTQYLVLKGKDYLYEERDYLTIPVLNGMGPSIIVDQIRRDENQHSMLVRFWLTPQTHYWVSWTTRISPDGQFEFYSAPQHIHIPLVRMAWKCIDLYPDIFSFSVAK